MHPDTDLPTVDDASPECVLLTDAAGDVVWAAPSTSDVLGRPPTALVGTETVQSLFGPAVPDPLSTGGSSVGRTLETTPPGGEPRLVAVTAETVDASVAAYRCCRVGDEQPALATVLDRVTDAVVAFDTEWRYTYANDAAVALLGTPRAALLGAVIWDLFPETRDSAIQRSFERAMATQDSATLDWYWAPSEQHLAVRLFPSPTGLSVYFRDISDREAREVALRRERDLVTQLLAVTPIGLAVHTPDGRFARLNERAEDILGHSREELVGEALNEPLWDASGPDGEPFPDESFPLNVVLRTGEATFGTEMTLRRADGTRRWLSVGAAPLLDADGDIERVVVAFEDVTERRRYERELRESEQQFRAVFEGTLDALVLADDDGTYLDVNQAACDLYGLDEADLVGRNVADFAPPGYDAAPVWDDFLETGRLRGEFPLVRPDGETRVTDFVATANIAPGLHLSALRDITERKADEEQLAAQHDELARLNDSNELIRGVHRSVVGATDREGIEAAVCDGLAASDAYPVAMTARLTADGAVQVDQAAGLSPAALSTLRADRECALDSLVRRAATERSITVRSTRRTDDTDPLGDLAAAHGLRTLGTVPIENDGVVYGVLTVGSTHADAFSGRDRDVFAELGRLIGAAIAAIQTKKLLYSTAFLELVVAAPAAVEPLAALNEATGGRWALDGVVPVGSGRYLLYVDAGEKLAADVERAAADVAGIEGVRHIATGSRQLLELRVGHDTPLSALLEAGGRIQGGRIEDGVSRIAVDVTLDTDVRTYLDRVERRGHAVDLLAKREVERAAPAGWAGDGGDTGLTGRQRTVLEAAYLSGYFDWPRRRTTGEELADSLDIASSTLHQHLRVASAKVFEQYFDPPGGPE